MNRFRGRGGWHVLFAAFLLCCTAGAAFAQTGKEEAPSPIADIAARVIERMGGPATRQRGLETPVSVNVRDMDLRSAVRLLADAAGVNLAMGKDVEGKVTCSLKNVTARVALEAFLRTNGYDFIEHNGLVVVVAKGQEAAFGTRPATRKMVTRTFRIPYTGKEKEFQAGGEYAAQAKATGKGVEEAIRDMLSPRGRMAYYERQHLVIVEDDQANVQMIEKFVNELWAVPSQVFIDSKLLEVTLEEGEDLGLRWSLVQKVSRHGKRNQITGDLDRRGTTLELASPPVGLDRAFTYGIVNANIEAVVEALSSRSRVDLRSNPQVLVMNHRTATIVVGQEIPYLSSEESVGGGISPIRTYEFKEVAVRLDVTPHISEDGVVFLDVHPTVKSVIGYTEEPRQPILSTREAVTNVAVRDGSTLIIGGLVQRSITKNWDETPLLSKIPLLGWLFRQRSRRDTKNDLIFLLCPRVVTADLVDDLTRSKKGLLTEPPAHAGEGSSGRPGW